MNHWIIGENTNFHNYQYVQNISSMACKGGQSGEDENKCIGIKMWYYQHPVELFSYENMQENEMEKLRKINVSESEV